MSKPREFNPRRTLVALIFLALLVFYPYVRAHFQPRHFEIGGDTMGTTYTVKIANSRASNREVRRLHDRLEQVLSKINQQMSTYDPGSEISRFNTSTNTGFITASPEWVEVTQYAIKLARETHGAFDPTVRPLVDLWGFYRKQNQSGPSDAEIQKALKIIGAGQIETSGGNRIAKRHPQTSLDLSAVAKGYGVDELLQECLMASFRDVYVEIGGEIRTHGNAPSGGPWKIAIEPPLRGAAQGDSEYVRIALQNRAVASSGDYRNYFESDGQAYSHIIDPRTGFPVTNGVAATSVIAPLCMHADALATALMVLGFQEGLSLIEQLPDTEALIIARDAQGKLLDLRSSGFDRHLSP